MNICEVMNTDNITNGHGNTEQIIDIADQLAEKTKKDVKKEVRKSGYRPPEYVPTKDNRKDGSEEGDKKAIKISHGHGYVQDFESWIKSKISETKSDNK